MKTYRVGNAHPAKNLDALEGKLANGDIILTAPGETLPLQRRIINLPDGCHLRSEKEKVPTIIPLAPTNARIAMANWCEGAKVTDITIQQDGGEYSGFSVQGDNITFTRIRQIGVGRLLTLKGAFNVIVDGFVSGDSDDYGIYMGADSLKAINRQIRFKNGRIVADRKILHFVRIHDTVDVLFEDVILGGDAGRSLFTMKEWKKFRLTRVTATSKVAGAGFAPLPEDKEPGHFIDDVELRDCKLTLANFLDLGAGVGGGGGGGVKMFGGFIKSPQAAVNCRGTILDRQPPKDCEFHDVTFDAPEYVKGPSGGVKFFCCHHNGKIINS